MIPAHLDKSVAIFSVALLVLFSSAVAAQARAVPARSTIQAAVDAARPGDVVLVPAGTYRENVVVSTDGISIVGLRRDARRDRPRGRRIVAIDHDEVRDESVWTVEPVRSGHRGGGVGV